MKYEIINRRTFKSIVLMNVCKMGRKKFPAAMMTHCLWKPLDNFLRPKLIEFRFGDQLKF